MITDLGVVIGYEPESESEPAHFYILDQTRQCAVCCAPVSGFEELDHEELPKMAAFLWQKLKGVEPPEQLASTIASAWIHCFEQFTAGAVCKPPTLH